MKQKNFLSALLLLFTLGASAQTGTCGDQLTWTILDNTLTISGTGTMFDYDEGSSKTPWYAYRSSITSAVVSEGVTGIGAYAFADCSNLTTVEIAGSVASIGDYAFSLCFTLQIDGEYSGDEPFDMPRRRNGASNTPCNSLRSITCYAATPPSLLGEYVFFGVNKSVAVNVPAQSIALYQAAEQWKEFTIGAIAANQFTVTFMDGNTVLSEQTVEYDEAATEPAVEARLCQVLTWDKDFSSVTEDLIVRAVWSEAASESGTCGAEGNGSNMTWSLSCDGVLTISGSGAMKDYDIESETAPWYIYRATISSIVIEEGVTGIGANAFANCRNFTSIEIPASVSYIGGQAFALCYSLDFSGEIGEGESFDMPQRRNGPDENSCCLLRTIYCGAVNPPALGSNVFFTLDQSSITLYVPAQSIGQYQSAAQWKDFFVTTITPSHFTVTFMDGNTVIDEQTVEYGQGATAPEVETRPCQTLTWDKDFSSVTEDLIVQAVWTEAPNATGYCGAEGNGSNLTWTLTCDNILTISGSGAMKDYEDSSQTPWYAYRNSITSVVLPDGITTIGSYAFADCGGLTTFDIPSSVTYIGDYAFSLCFIFVINNEEMEEGEEYDMPQRRNSPDNNTCNHLQSITCYAVTPPALGENVFFGVNKSIPLYVPAKSIDQYKAADQWKDFFVQAIPGTGVTIVWQNEDGSILTTDENVPLGSTPEYKGEEPTKNADAQYTYTFAGWTDGENEYLAGTDLPEVTGDATYTATYTRTLKQYTVTFLDEDESVIDSRLWDYGTMPTCDEPTKNADTQYTYTFAGWTDGENEYLAGTDLPEVTGDATYTATYTRTLKQYTVTFMDGNTVLSEQTVDYGQGAIAPEVEVSQCSALSWDKDFSYITSDLTVYAVWTEAVLPTYSISANDEMQGNIYILQEPTCEDHTLKFRAAGSTDDYEFLQWSDGNTDNPRTIDLTQDTVLTAQFIYIDNSAYSEGIGTFSVSAKKQVKFSPGNLQYNAAQGSHLCADGTEKAGTLRFAKRQWYYVGDASNGNVYDGATKSNNKETSAIYNGWIDLFGWGTGYKLTEAGTNTAKYPNFTDWGQNAIHYGDTEYETGMWRTLSREEWVYLVRERENATSLFGMGTVNGVNGFILLPDEWTMPEGLTFTPATKKGMRWYEDMGVYSGGSNHYSANTYTVSEWMQMQAAGAVFMPAGGYRTGSHVNLTSTQAFYWSSTQDTESNKSYDFSFRSNYFRPQGLDIRSNGSSVRLVWDIPFIVTVLTEGEGTATGGGEYKDGAVATLTATPNEGYAFTKWSDGNTDNPREVTVTENATYTAIFEVITHDCSIETTERVTIWEDELPYTWGEVTFTQEGTETQTFRTIDGCDSTVILTLRVRHYDITLQENESSEYYDLFAEDYNGYTVNTATLNRQFSQGKWSTLCLPFNVNRALLTSVGMNGRLYEFRRSEKLENGAIEIYFSSAQSIEAGKGYIVNANSKLAAKTSFIFSDITINTDADTGDITTLTGYNDGSDKSTLYLIGTLRTGLLRGTQDGSTYIGLRNNKLYAPNSEEGTQMRAYRGIFRSTEPFNAGRVRIIAEGEEPIELLVENGELLESSATARKVIEDGVLYIERQGKVYTVQGQRIE